MTDKSIYLTISHNLFVDRDQRYQIIMEDDTSINITGISVPVWAFTKKSLGSNEPAEEILCDYKITNKSGSIIEPNDSGYTINIRSKNIRSKLFDRKDGGEGRLVFKHRNFVDFKGVSYKVIHYVTIQDLEVLHNTLTTNLK